MICSEIDDVIFTAYDFGLHIHESKHTLFNMASLDGVPLTTGVHVS
jgi:hypothetical protein